MNNHSYSRLGQLAHWLLPLSIVLTVSAPAIAKNINLPGSVAGGVDLCVVGTTECITTPDDQETPVTVLSYRDGKGEALILLQGKQYVAAPNQISVSYKGCDLSLSSFIIGSLCPGIK